MMEPLGLERHFSPSGNISLKVTKNDTDMKFLISEFTRLSQINQSDDTFKSLTNYYYTKYQPVEICPRNIVTLLELTNAPNSLFNGRFFLCRTVTDSIKMGSLLIMVVEIPDPVMINQGALLSLYNYINPQNEEYEYPIPILSKGTILIVKNPKFFRSSADTVYAVKCDIPGDVLILDDQKSNELFPGLIWSSGELGNEEKSLIMRPWWNWWRVMRDWKAVAHLRLQKKNYVGAFEAYATLLNSYPMDVEALNLRSSLYLNLKVYRKCLDDSERILEMNNVHQGAICHKALSLIGLGKYTDAKSLLEYHIQKCKPFLDASKKAILMEIVSKANTWSRQEGCGEYDMVKMLQCPSTFIHDCADYVGNVLQRDIPLKGKGMVAKADIKCGELLTATKAFAMAFADRTGPEESLILNLESMTLRSTTQVKLFASVAHRLLTNPDLGKELYKLYDGTERSRDDGNCIGIDMKRISRICEYNSFSGGADGVKLKDEEIPQGLWLQPSYFNHRCFGANSRLKVFGDFMFIRACKNIKKGEEITVPYLSCCKSYPERLKTLSKYGFICECSLCQLDAKDSEKTQIRRTKILEEIDNFYIRSNVQCTQIMKLIEELNDLRRHKPELNIYVLDPLLKLAAMNMERGDYKQAVEIWNCVYKSASKTDMIAVARVSCYNAIRFNLACNKNEAAKKLVKDLKAIFIQEYGTDSKEILECIHEDLVQLLDQEGIPY